MEIAVPVEFQDICSSIVTQHRSLGEWRAIESDDMFQSEHFCGGFNATEDAFCFSHYSTDGSEFWFQLTLNDVAAVATGQLQNLTIRAADTFNA